MATETSAKCKAIKMSFPLILCARRHLINNNNHHLHHHRRQHWQRMQGARSGQGNQVLRGVQRVEQRDLHFDGLQARSRKMFAPATDTDSNSDADEELPVSHFSDTISKCLWAWGVATRVLFHRDLCDWKFKLTSAGTRILFCSLVIIFVIFLHT